jgi:plasmid stabilization system protein ParE
VSPRVYRLIVWPEAEEDLTEATHWYESQERGLGREFLRAFRAATAVLRRTPLHYQPVAEQTRRILLRRFPYGVFYEVHGADVVVLACLHTARDPEAWERRIPRTSERPPR